MKRFQWYLIVLVILGGLSSCDKMKDLEFLRIASFDF